jgi:serine O-acetyltransferase
MKAGRDELPRMLAQLLKADLARQYAYDGVPDRPATLIGVARRVVNPHFAPVVLYRVSHALHRSGFSSLARLASALNFILFGVEIAMRCEIGPGLYFAHTAGIVIGAARIGRDALIYNGVTIGAKTMDVAYDLARRPIIGDGVMIGAGAKVLGGIVVGDGVTIGANAVVTRSVAPRLIVAGIPARVIGSEDRVGQ